MTIATPALSLRRWPVITALGIVQIFAWGSSYYLMAPLAGPIVADSGWPLPWVIGALSLGLLVAGLASPRVGTAIARHGGRPVLAGGMILLATGLLVLAAAPNLPVFYLGWLVIGLGMSAGLYDPAFASLGRLYGREARSAITALTLWGGFASTVCWPISAWAVEQFGWRGTAAGYSILHLTLCLPLIWRMIPREMKGPRVVKGSLGRQVALSPTERRAFLILATIFTLAAIIAAMLSVHLLTLLGARGVSTATAVAMGALIGPAQVASRVVEMASGGKHHPKWTLLFAAFLFAAGVALLAFGFGFSGLALILYGGGNGLFSIARGALPMALFGPERYPVLMGRMARPALIAQAVAPLAAALAIQVMGPNTVLFLLMLLAAATVPLTLIIVVALARR